ncbi:hypothetical protein QJS04_geneDACA000812 [Acorus gramineus]|uniref:Uncharacterized protein n=1 Tax=Acorus gramineus TaxID=55184 RepID=A0AAV9BFA1_ACOGR|nr:hypothetical protein QJS04_geneDACA000812 [Acorus gramineus]
MMSARFIMSTSSATPRTPTSPIPPPAVLPLKPIPGTYGPPLLGPLRDRLDYFWFQGADTFFRKRATTHKSTVFRTNIPPTFPFFVGTNPEVVALVDCASFASLFDSSLVDKTDVLIGPYTPSLSFTGGTRVCVYLDVTDPKHTKVKSFCMDLLKRSSKVWASEFLNALDTMWTTIEGDLEKVSGKGGAGFIVPLQRCIFRFLCKALAMADPEKVKEIDEYGFAMLDKWLAVQLLPTTGTGVIPQPLEEIFLHSFPLPFLLVKNDYLKIYEFLRTQGKDVVDNAVSEYGLSTEEAINNILFVLGFNAFGGFSVFFPKLITTIGSDETGLQEKLREEVRRVVGTDGVLDLKKVREMELVTSTVRELLRLNPPVPLQYGRARRDFTLSSNEASFEVKQGELLCGYQPLAMRDAKVFEDPERFVPDRFVEAKGGRELLEYLYWSNGRETGTPSVENKQCAAKDYVVGTACLFVAYLFTRYDGFRCEPSSFSISAVEKARDGKV